MISDAFETSVLPIEIWFWQRYVSPHTVDLLNRLAALHIDVTLVTCDELTADRQQLGWREPGVFNVNLLRVTTLSQIRDLAAGAPDGAIHIVSGLRGHGLLRHALHELGRRPVDLWIWLEMLDDTGLSGLVRRYWYRIILARWHQRLSGILATGYKTPGQLTSLGVPPDKVYEFAYFLPTPKSTSIASRVEGDAVELLFVGQIIPRKSVGLLIQALAGCVRDNLRLTIVGCGKQQPRLMAQTRAISNRVQWLGQRPIEDIPDLMRNADYLVLPSRHDGFGAVVSEALIAGTAVIVSDTCGSAGSAQASGAARVFRAGSLAELMQALSWAHERGKQTAERRAELSAWAGCLTGSTGASYLLQVLRHQRGQSPRPCPPWIESVPAKP